MNDLLKSKLQILAEDEIMMRAIKEAVYEKIEQSKPNINDTDNNSVLGQKYRATIEAKEIIDGAFVEIASYKGQKSNKQLINKER